MDRPGTAIDHGWIRHGRVRLNLAMRLASRAHAVLSVGGAAKGAGRTALAVASAGADVALVRRLRASDRAELGLHALADAADLAAWTALATRPGPDQLSTAMTSSHPLAIEVGARHGAAGLLVPLATTVISGLVARARGWKHDTSVVVWQVAAALGGAGLARYVGRMRTRRLAAHEVQFQPDLARAELAAENDVALGRDNLIDEVQRAAVLIQLGSGSPPAPAMPWKAGLAEQTRRSHRYLVDVLLVWQRHHNATSELAQVVALEPAAELAPVILDADAADHLVARLDRLDLHGRLSVTRTGPPDPRSSHLPLQVGSHAIDLDTGVEAVRLHVDPLPGGLAWLSLWLAAAAPQDGVPLAAALGPAAAGLGLMGWAHRAGRGSDPRPVAAPAVLGSTALTLGAAVFQTATARRPRTDPQIPRIPASLALRGHAFVTALARPDLPHPVLAVAWIGGVVALVASFLLTSRPRPVREFLAELTWVGMSATMARAFTDGIASDAADLEGWVAAEDEQRLAEAAATGRRHAVDQVRRALEDALALEAAHAPTLDPAVRAEARRRLQACSDALAALV